MTNEEFMLDVFRVGVSMYDFMGPGGLRWRCDGEYAPLTVWVDCSDFFQWASADMEKVTPNTIGLLKQAIADVRAIDPDSWLGGELYAARQRKKRPMKAWYRHTPEPLHAMFDACGPERAD